MTSSPVVTASVNFFLAPVDGARAYQMVQADPLTGERKNNFKTVSHDVTIENVRGNEGSFTLDTTGFQWFRAPSKHTSFKDDDAIENEYYPESVELYKKLTGASKVVIFDHTIRQHRPGQANADSLRGPATQAHVDQSALGAVNRVHRHVPEEAEELLKKRFQIINLWRPIHHPAWDWPLALCDYRSFSPERDTVPIALVYPDREGEIYGVKYSPDQKWKYLKGMTPDELVLIKCFDSKQDDNVAVFTPHTAFNDPTTPPDVPHRESIELRALVFYD